MKWYPQHGNRPLNVFAASALLAGIFLGLASTSTRAGQLDVALLEQQTGAAENVLLYLHEKGYKNVGVLPFHVDKGGKDKGYDVAPLALNLTTRLENALILSQDPKSKVLVGIIRDAAGTAPRDGVKAYQTGKGTKEDFEELFAEQYTLAWGDRKVKADAFLTGRIINPSKSKDKAAYVTVIIEIFDRDSWEKDKGVKFETVKRMEVLRDRSLFGDLGIAFSIPRDKLDSFLKGRGPASDEDRDALLKPNGGFKKYKTDVSVEKPSHTPENVGGMAFKVYYQDKPQAVKANAEGILEAPTPAVGTKIKMILERLDDDKDTRTRAVVVKVNGQSLWRMEELESRLCRKWLFAPGSKPEEFEGFYFKADGTNLKPFDVQPAEKTKGKFDDKKIGWIEVSVYAEAVADKKDEEKKEEKLVASSKVISLKSAGSQASYDGKVFKQTSLSTRPLKEVQEALQRENNVKVDPILFPREKGSGKGKNVIATAGSAKPGGDIKEQKALDTPELIGSISIRYYLPTK